MNKLYTLIVWHNNTAPALNEDNLNAMSEALDNIDTRVVEIAGDVIEVVPQIQGYLEQAQALEEALELLSRNPPYIGANGNWYVFNTETNQYEDSGVDASITVSIADITMIAVDAEPYVTNTGTNTDPVFHLYLPRSPQGETGNGIDRIEKTNTSGLVDTYTIYYTNGTTTTYTVTNGQSGSGDMNESDYDPTGDVKATGGIISYLVANYQRKLTFDTTPTEGSNNPVKSGGVYTALEDKVDWDDYAQTGAVNLRNKEVYTITINGITFTVDADKKITVSGINDGVGPSSMLLFNKVVSDNPLKVSGVPSNANNNYCCLEVYDNTSNSRIGYVTGNTPEVIIPANGHNVSVRIYVWKNQDVSTAMEFPVLIAPVNYNGDYVAPVKTNKELTSEISNLTTTVDGKADIISGGTWKHTSLVTCDLSSGGLAYLLTSSGILVLSTSSGSINIRTGLALEAETSSYFNKETSGLTSTITVWGESTFETSKNAIWSLIPIHGRWTMTLS